MQGLLPSGVSTLEGQLRRVYAQYRRQPDDLAKNVMLGNMRDRNEVLFYRLLSTIWRRCCRSSTPTVGKAIEQFSHEYRRPRGVFFVVNHPEDVEESLRNYGLDSEDVDLLVATDSEGILGIGDQGVGGIDISIGQAGRLHRRGWAAPATGDPGGAGHGHRQPAAAQRRDVYRQPARPGARPALRRPDRCLRHSSQQAVPARHVALEDFGASNARRILNKYASQVYTSTTTCGPRPWCWLPRSLRKATGSRMRDQRVVIHGAGTAGIGIVDMMRDVMIREGLTEQEATRRFWAIDSRGLLTDNYPEHCGTSNSPTPAQPPR